MKSETLTILEDIAYSWMGADKEIYLVHSSTLYAMKIDKIPATLYKRTQIVEGIGWIPGPGQWSYFRHL